MQREMRKCKYYLVDKDIRRRLGTSGVLQRLRCNHLVGAETQGLKGADDGL
jgi:hypothetical protein